jgi:hypothetical protein
MASQGYLQIQNNVVTNTVEWDGNPNTWTPPADATMLVQSTTPAMLWNYDYTNKVWFLEEFMGCGNIGFTWDGSVVTTYELKPTEPPRDLVTTGTLSA